MLQLNIIAVTLIMAWSLWSTLSSKVDDGIIGKLFLGYVCMSSMAVLFGVHGDIATAETTHLHIGLAALAMRQILMKYFWYRIRNKYFCKTCPNRRSTDTKVQP